MSVDKNIAAKEDFLQYFDIGDIYVADPTKSQDALFEHCSNNDEDCQQFDLMIKNQKYKVLYIKNPAMIEKLREDNFISTRMDTDTAFDTLSTPPKTLLNKIWETLDPYITGGDNKDVKKASKAKKNKANK